MSFNGGDSSIFLQVRQLVSRDPFPITSFLPLATHTPLGRRPFFRTILFQSFLPFILSPNSFPTCPNRVGVPSLPDTDSKALWRIPFGLESKVFPLLRPLSRRIFVQAVAALLSEELAVVPLFFSQRIEYRLFFLLCSRVTGAYSRPSAPCCPSSLTWYLTGNIQNLLLDRGAILCVNHSHIPPPNAPPIALLPVLRGTRLFDPRWR